MLKIQRSKSCDAILIMLKNLDKGENQSQLSFRVYQNTTVFDLIVHIQKYQSIESEIQIYFEQNVQFFGDMNQYLIDIIKTTKNRNIGYRLYTKQSLTKSENQKSKQQGQSEIQQQQKSIMATQIPKSEYYNLNINNQSQNRAQQQQIKNKENNSEYYNEKSQYAKDNSQQFKQFQNNNPQQYQQFQQCINNQEFQNIYPTSEQQPNNYEKSIVQQDAFRKMELELKYIKDQYRILQTKNEELIKINEFLRIENEELKKRQNNSYTKEISPYSQRRQDKILTESYVFTNVCKHQIKEKELVDIILNALNHKVLAKCLQCKLKISNSLCRQISIYGSQYLEMKNQIDLQLLCESIKQKKLKTDKQLNFAECENRSCSFICIWQDKLANSQKKSQKWFCINCLQNSVKDPSFKIQKSGEKINQK